MTSPKSNVQLSQVTGAQPQVLNVDVQAAAIAQAADMPIQQKNAEERI